jgi:hypothetical protein
MTPLQNELIEALETIAHQLLSTELPIECHEFMDWEGGYDSCIETARAAVQLVKDIPQCYRAG